MTFADQIATTRRALHLTQTELATAIGRSAQTVSNWECGRVTPWPRDQVEILKALLNLRREPVASRNGAGDNEPDTIIGRILADD